MESYGRMMSDPSRGDAYEGALRAACRPGSVVLDLGAGTGMMSLYACRAGAGRVYAVEASDAIAVAREVAADNGVADRITFIQARSTDITLPERVDVIVADLRGVLPMFDASLASMIDARRFLAPGGVIIPSNDIVRGALVEAAAAFDSFVAPWRKDARGFDLSAVERTALQSWRKHLLTADVMLTVPQDVAAIDYRTLETPSVRGTIRSSIARSGTAHGLAVWFDAHLFGDFAFSNAPGATETLYGQGFFPLPAPVAVEAGDVFEMTLRADWMRQLYVWSWDTRISSAAGSVKSVARQSTFHAWPLSAARLQRLDTDACPSPGVDAAVDSLILEQLNGHTTLAAIAESVQQRFTERFADTAAALRRVRTVVTRYLPEG